MEEKSFDGINILKLFGKSFIIEIIVSIIGMFILALILSKTSVSDSIMGNTIIGISAFSISLGSFICGRKVNIKGIILGIIHGILYMGTLYIISSISRGNFVLSKEGIIMMIVGIVAGILGGILGANFKSRA